METMTEGMDKATKEIERVKPKMVVGNAFVKSKLKKRLDLLKNLKFR